MCQCGCVGSVHYTQKITISDEEVIAIGLYRGCDNCDAPAGVQLARVKKYETEEDRANDIISFGWEFTQSQFAKEFDFHPEIDGIGFVYVIDKQIVKSKVKADLLDR